ncbi:MFS transporter [Zhongshania sp.]|uniref:MFS transporter n=1 Tax=Zhongshania sp. TaxID=1971902 RepID=UPI0035641412
MSEPTQANPASDDIIHESLITLRQALVLLVCYFAYILDGFDIVVISYTAPAISADWGIQSQELGLVFSSSLLGMTLGAMFLASLADLYGRKLVVGGMLLVVGLTTIAVVYADTVWQLVALRFITGLGLGTIMAALAPLAGEFSPSRYRTLILALLVSGASLGPILGGLVTSSAIDTYGWQSVFMAAGVLTLIAAALMFVLVPESMVFIIRRKPQGALERVNKTLTYLGHASLEQLPPVNEAAAKESASVKSLVMRSRWIVTLKVWGAFFCAYSASYFLSSWLPQILVQAGFDQERAIQAVVLASLGSLVGAVIFGWLGRWWALNRLIASSFVIGALSYLIVGGLIDDIDAVNPGWFFWTLLFVSGFTTSGAFSNLYTVAMKIYPAQIRSTGIGWATGIGRCGAVVSPALAGFLLAAGVSLTSLLGVFGIFFLVAATCVFLLTMRELPSG